MKELRRKEIQLDVFEPPPEVAPNAEIKKSWQEEIAELVTAAGLPSYPEAVRQAIAGYKQASKENAVQKKIIEKNPQYTGARGWKSIVENNRPKSVFGDTLKTEWLAFCAKGDKIRQILSKKYDA